MIIQLYSKNVQNSENVPEEKFFYFSSLINKIFLHTVLNSGGNMSESAFLEKIKKVHIHDELMTNSCKTLEKKVVSLEKERHSLKSQLGHARKEIRDFKTLLKEKNVLLTKKEKELQIINLEIIKRDLMEKHMVNMCFKKHIIVHFDMDEKELEKNILTFKSSLEIFKNEILNRP